MRPLACPFWGPAWVLFVKLADEIGGSAKPSRNSLGAGQGGTGLVSAGAGALCRASGSRTERLLHRRLPTHLQERVELLLFLPVHISFLKELEIGDKAPTWSHIPGGMFTCGSQGGRWAHSSEMRGWDRAGRERGWLGVWTLLRRGQWEPMT